jgi:CTP:molybdopterin cytidylyltransferase MocA
MIILAAGLSERIGAFKPLLPVGGQPAVLRCIHTAQTAGVRDILVVTGHKRSELEETLREKAPGIGAIHNSRYQEGMFSSVLAGASALLAGYDAPDGVFILPVDCCAITPGTLTKLADEFNKAGRTAVTRPKFKGKRGHPPLIPAQYINQLLNYKGENGLKGFLSPLPTIEIEMEDQSTLLDMDTPEDYAALLKHLEKKDRF